MVNPVKIRITYTEGDYVEKFTIRGNTNIEWNSKPGRITLAQRKQFMYLLESLHKLMVEASMKKLELEEEV